MRSTWIIVGIAVSFVVLSCLGLAGLAVYTAGRSTSATINAAVETALATPDYRRYDVRDMAKDPDGYKGRGIEMDGVVFNIQQRGDQTVVQMHVEPRVGDAEPIVIAVNNTLPDVYVGTRLTIQGVGAGSIEMQNAFGATISQPLIHADHITVLR